MLAAIPLLGHGKLQHIPGQPLKVECGYTSGRGVENRHMNNLSSEKHVHSLHKKESEEEENILRQVYQCLSVDVVYNYLNFVQCAKHCFCVRSSCFKNMSLLFLSFGWKMSHPKRQEQTHLVHQCSLEC